MKQIQGKSFLQVLLVNCYGRRQDELMSAYLSWIGKAVEQIGIELGMQTFYAEALTDESAYDGAHAAILTGSEKMVSTGEVEPALQDFIQRWFKPMLGICYGHQALAHTFGASVAKGEQKKMGNEPVFPVNTDPLWMGFADSFSMNESHEEIVVDDDRLQRHFSVLAVNAEKKVEAIRHRERPFWGVQFHPERSGDPGIQLLVNFLHMI